MHSVNSWFVLRERHKDDFNAVTKEVIEKVINNNEELRTISDKVEARGARVVFHFGLHEVEINAFVVYTTRVTEIIGILNAKKKNLGV